jgi:hypothetical protein
VIILLACLLCTHTIASAPCAAFVRPAPDLHNLRRHLLQMLLRFPRFASPPGTLRSVATAFPAHHSPSARIAPSSPLHRRMTTTVHSKGSQAPEVTEGTLLNISAWMCPYGEHWRGLLLALFTSTHPLTHSPATWPPAHPLQPSAPGSRWASRGSSSRRSLSTWSTSPSGCSSTTPWERCAVSAASAPAAQRTRPAAPPQLSPQPAALTRPAARSGAHHRAQDGRRQAAARL